VKLEKKQKVKTKKCLSATKKGLKKQIIFSGKSKAGKVLRGKSENKKASYKIHLKSPEDCRRLLSLTINELRENKIVDSRARTIGYLVNGMLSVLELTDLSKQLAELKERVGK